MGSLFIHQFILFYPLIYWRNSFGHLREVRDAPGHWGRRVLNKAPAPVERTAVGRRVRISKCNIIECYAEQGKWTERKWCTFLHGVSGESSPMRQHSFKVQKGEKNEIGGKINGFRGAPTRQHCSLILSFYLWMECFFALFLSFFYYYFFFLRNPVLLEMWNRWRKIQFGTINCAFLLSI